MLLHLAGPDVQEIFTTLTATGDATDYNRAVEALKAYFFLRQVNSAFARQTFHQISQKPGETVQQFATRLKKSTKDYDFGTDTDNQIRDAVLNKCSSTYIKRKLLEEGQGLNLNRTLEVAAQCNGVCSAGEQYQREIASVLAGIEGAENISDDIVVYGPDTETLDKRLCQTIERLQECGLTLNTEKCLFNMDRLVFMGMLLSEKGTGPTEDRVKAVLEAEGPKNTTDVRSFLGLANYSSRLIPHFATLSEPLRRLTNKETPFEFGPEQTKSFESLHSRIL